MAFQLTSTAFENDGYIPDKFTCYGTNVSPPLAWSEPPAKTQSFALIVEDFDSPKGQSCHWLLWNIAAARNELAEGIAKVPVLPDGVRQGHNDFKKLGYDGPCPLQGHAHRYVFRLHALDFKPDLKPRSSCRELTLAMDRHVLARAELVGRFIPSSREARMRYLESEKEYVMLTHRVKRELEAAYAERPDVVTKFFRKFSLTSVYAIGEIREFLTGVHPERVHRALEAYVKHANRFRVVFRLKTHPLEFKTHVWSPYGEKFHVKILGDHLEPGGRRRPDPADPDDPFVEYFRSDALKILKEIQRFVDLGKATFVRIDDDGPGYSVLKDLESFAYKDDGVTFFIHDAEQPYLGCIFGEGMNKDMLADMGRVVTEFQKTYFDRTFGGRPPDMERLKAGLKTENKPISGVEKAIELAQGGDEKMIKSEEVKQSKLRSKIRRLKS